MRARSLGFRTDLMVRRLAGSEISDHGDHIVVRTPLSPEFYWGNFLLLSGTAAAHRADRWIEEFDRHFPKAGHVAIGWDRRSQRALAALQPLQRLGLELETSLVMTAAAPLGPARPGPLPELRRLSASADWRALEALEIELWQQDGGGRPAHLDFLRSRVDECRRLSETGHAGYFGCFEAGRLVSSAGVVVGHGLGRFQNVQTAGDRRRRGLAGATVSMAAAFAEQQLGARRLVIVADPAGPAVSLYRRLGFQDTEQQTGLQMVRA